MAKSFRIWRLYRSPVEVTAMTDWQLLIFVILLTIPMIILLFLWTLLGTPTADLEVICALCVWLLYDEDLLMFDIAPGRPRSLCVYYGWSSW